MPENTRVHRCVNHLKEEGKAEGSAIAICQSSTNQGYASGRSLKSLRSEFIKALRGKYKRLKQE